MVAVLFTSYFAHVGDYLKTVAWNIVGLPVGSVAASITALRCVSTGTVCGNGAASHFLAVAAKVWRNFQVTN